MKPRRLLPVLIVALLTGCGYAVNDLYRRDIRTVYVEFFDNQTYRRELEVALTRAVHEELRLRTPLTFAPRDEADSVLTGEITDADVSTAVKTEDDRILLQRASVSVRFQWRDNLTGRDIVPPTTVQERARADRAIGREPFDEATRQTAVFDLVLQEAALGIVEKMESSW